MYIDFTKEFMTLTQTTTKSLYQNIYSSISGAVNDNRESESIARLLLEHYFGITYTDIILDKYIFMNNELNSKISSAIIRLNEGEPIQYILGYAYFRDRKFTVNSSVLIPRPETEELVSHIIKNNNTANLSVLDIGTGSGCIAISLKKELPYPSIVHAIEIDKIALYTASKNAESLDAEVIFIEKDILEAISLPQRYDIIVSNPPYVLESDKQYMKANVLNYEPHKALFVPAHDPVIFYRKIVELGRRYLNSQGRIYFEINELFGQEVYNLLYSNGFTDIIIQNDIHNKARIVEAYIGQ